MNYTVIGAAVAIAVGMIIVIILSLRTRKNPLFIIQNKKQLKWKKNREFPAEVIEAVCWQYIKDGANVKNEWPWFLTVLKAESAAHFSRQSIHEGEEFKKAPIASALKEIIKGIVE